eukprot:844004-Pelagomonas_calceolata.AAC.1
MAKQPSDVLPPKLGMHAVVFTPRGHETPAGAAQQALQARLEQRGNAMVGDGSFAGICGTRGVMNVLMLAYVHACVLSGGAAVLWALGPLCRGLNTDVIGLHAALIWWSF